MKDYVLSDEITYDEVIRIIKEARKIKRELDIEGKMAKNKLVNILEIIECDVLDLKRKCGANVQS